MSETTKFLKFLTLLNLMPDSFIGYHLKGVRDVFDLEEYIELYLEKYYSPSISSTKPNSKDFSEDI